MLVKLVHVQNEVIKSGSIVGADGKEEEDTTQDVPTDGTDAPEDIDESERPGQEIEEIKSTEYRM